MFFHAASIIFVCAPVSESIKTTQGSTAWCTSPSLPRITLGVPTVTDDCGAGKDTHLNDSKRCVCGAISNKCETALPDSCSTTTKTHAVPLSLLQLHLYMLKQISTISTTLPSFSPLYSLPQPKKSSVDNPNKDKYCLVAELQPVSENLTVNMQLSMTLMGQRMGPHFEQKHRQLQ